MEFLSLYIYIYKPVNAVSPFGLFSSSEQRLDDGMMRILAVDTSQHRRPPLGNRMPKRGSIARAQEGINSKGNVTDI